MKKLLFIFLLSISGIASAQFVEFGIKGGVNFSNIEGKLGAFDFSTRSSYHIGGLLEVGLLQNLSLQPEVLYSVQGAKINGNASYDNLDLKYINIPIMLKFYLISGKLSLEAGPQFSFLADNNLKEAYKAQDYDFSVGGGIAIDLTNSLFIQARYLAGMSEISKKAEAKNSNIQLSLGLKF